MDQASPRGGILIVDDDDTQRSLTRLLLATAGVTLSIESCDGGPQAIAYLNLCLRERRPLPLVVLLDLAMPTIDGIGVLRWIKETPALAALRVIILTSSTAKTDRDLCAELGADAYLVKHPVPAVFLCTLVSVGLPETALITPRSRSA